MSNEEVVNELKEKKLPTFGTTVERKDRLKKHYEEIEKLKQNREERRKKMDDLRKQKNEREMLNEAQGIKVDIDFQVMVEHHMKNVQPMQPHIPADQLKICVCVKKRPIFRNELASGEIDCVSASNPSIIVHECKYKVDGITKLIDNSEFQFDNAFSHEESNSDLYNYSIGPIIDLAFNQGIVTVFAYGQTGSGKTYSMQGLQELAINDLFKRGINYFQDYNRNFSVTVAMYEIYSGKVYDLLNGHEQLKIQEDKGQKIQIAGLKEQFVESEQEILNLINLGNSVRTTHATKANDTSSRSHAICQIKVSEDGVKNVGKLLLVDLAGSERAQDCQSNNKERQQEGAEINKSLLALKECIRALDSQKGQAQQGQHIPFRGSKLTMVLRDSFIQSEKNKIIMLACICPGSSSAEHTLNTLRYADRLKERSGNGPAYQVSSPIASGAQLYPNQLDEQLRLFQKHNSLRNNNNFEQSQDTFQTQYHKATTLGIGKLKQTARGVASTKNTNELFYQQKFERSHSNSDLHDIEVVEKEQSKFKPKVISNQSPEIKHIKGQHKEKSDSIGKGIVLNKNQSKLVQSKYQQSQQKNAGDNVPQNDSLINDEGPIEVTKKSISPRQNLPKPKHSTNNAATYFKKPAAIQMKELQAHPKTPQNNRLKFNYNSKQNGKQDDDAMIYSDEEDQVIAEENLLNNHLECVKEEAQLITQEGEIITKIEKAMVNQEDYDIKQYIKNTKEIAQQKLEMYSKLLEEIEDFEKKYGKHI